MRTLTDVQRQKLISLRNSLKLKAKVTTCLCGHKNEIRIVKSYHQEWYTCPRCKDIGYSQYDKIWMLNDGRATMDWYLEAYAIAWG